MVVKMGEVVKGVLVRIWALFHLQMWVLERVWEAKMDEAVKEVLVRVWEVKMAWVEAKMDEAVKEVLVRVWALFHLQMWVLERDSTLVF